MLYFLTVINVRGDKLEVLWLETEMLPTRV